MTTKVRYMADNGEMDEIERKDMLDALQYVKDKGIKGAKFKVPSGNWMDVDRFMEMGRQMFEPLSAEEEAVRRAEYELNRDKPIHLTASKL